jgi:uncharacterized protein DUF6339
MKLQFFSSRFLVRLREKASMNASKYGADSGWLDALAAGQAYVHESGYVVDPPPTLVIATEGNAQLDAENARRVYSWLRNLTPSVAMEERLWAHLTHCVFAEYMAIRWPAKNEGVVCRRYLFEGNSFAALARNGIARLWWAGNLTHDETRSDPFELTKVLFMRQDIQVSLLERTIGKCPNVRTTVLEYLRDNGSRLSEDSFGRRIQLLLKELNLWGGVAILDALPKNEIENFLKRFGESLAGGKSVTT